MVRRELVAAKAGRARVWLNDAATTLLGPLDTFQADAKSRDLSLFYLFLAIPLAFEIGSRTVTRSLTTGACIAKRRPASLHSAAFSPP